MSKRHVAILVMLTFASSFALTWGMIRSQAASGTMLDYRVVYIGARCLIQHCDPYNEPEVMQVYFAEGGVRLPAEPGQRQHYLASEQLYPPTAEMFFAPFGALRWPVSYCLWIGITFALMTAAAFLMWDAAQKSASDPPFYLACFLLANTGVVFSGGNPAGIAVSLCLIGTWCFIEGRALALGVLCLAISLCIKPHDTAAVWLYMLLLGTTYRKRAIQSFFIVATLTAAAVFWVSRIAPHWLFELRQNMARYSSGGSQNDPAGFSGSMMVNLQAALAVVHNDPRFYNLATYAICLPLLVIWVMLTARSRRTLKGIWLGLAAIAPLSLLPLYHRPHDAKLLLLTLPACSALWAEGGGVAGAAIAFTAAGILITSDLPIAALNIASSSLHLQPGVGNILPVLVVARSASLVLLAMSVFYLWAFARQNAIDRTVSAAPAHHQALT